MLFRKNQNLKLSSQNETVTYNTLSFYKSTKRFLTRKMDNRFSRHPQQNLSKQSICWLSLVTEKCKLKAQKGSTRWSSKHEGDGDTRSERHRGGKTHKFG